MAKYIEREAVIHAILGQPPEPHYPEWYYRDISEIPAADVVGVVHGEWVSVCGDVIWKCSICDAEISTSWDYENEDMFKYCPCCGAKMDGERKEV
jgi:hypothetical protein